MQKFELAGLRCAKQIMNSTSINKDTIRDFQISLSSGENLLSIRDLNSTYISKLVKIPGEYRPTNRPLMIQGSL